MSGTMHLGPQHTESAPPQPALPLSPVQIATLEAVASAALDGLSTQIRRATPFSPVKAGLRTRAAGMRQILRDHELPLRSVPLVTEVLEARLEILRQQLRHCDSPHFKARLRAEERRMQEILSRLPG